MKLNLHTFTQFHLVEISPWPLVGSAGAFSIASGLIAWFHLSSMTTLLLGLLIVILVMIAWWGDIVKEATMQGYHTLKVISGHRGGMILFITSEIMFFVAFFWAFFHSALSPTPELGCVWPPLGMTPIDTFAVPLLNTGILLGSGVTVTWAHHSIMTSNFSEAKISLALTIFLGAWFTFLQAEEYFDAPFSIADSVYGSTFFVATGFHGLHVLIGTTLLATCLSRLMVNHFSDEHHWGFEASAWYWHFVDVVWIFLYLMLYWWGC